ncbi:uncharacterized protein G2W53_007906 [Senna tora]|uniref:Uncharacterized protein n=1 Tax=Senna tora TaxID=362788 RepID=A0A834X7B1_9FABA|nr:uncharacterized protein G2W53_007906 [Senna tora]
MVEKRGTYNEIFVKDFYASGQEYRKIHIYRFREENVRKLRRQALRSFISFLGEYKHGFEVTSENYNLLMEEIKYKGVIQSLCFDDDMPSGSTPAQREGN